jgi:carbon starvation protein
MRRIIFNDYIDASLAGLFILVVVTVTVYGVRTAMQARGGGQPSAKESPFVPAPPMAGA